MKFGTIVLSLALVVVVASGCAWTALTVTTEDGKKTVSVMDVAVGNAATESVNGGTVSIPGVAGAVSLLTLARDTVLSFFGQGGPPTPVDLNVTLEGLQHVSPPDDGSGSGDPPPEG